MLPAKTRIPLVCRCLLFRVVVGHYGSSLVADILALQAFIAVHFAGSECQALSLEWRCEASRFLRQHMRIKPRYATYPGSDSHFWQAVLPSRNLSGRLLRMICHIQHQDRVSGLRAGRCFGRLRRVRVGPIFGALHDLAGGQDSVYPVANL